MAASLQERLNYLVNYSSQLIFVGGDTLSSQTKALESFLFQQGENTEIAYVVSEPELELAEYRRQLCQQLLGQSIHLYHRPLNECLASLNSFEGPVMIAITRAEFIPKQLLQELWELVLQSRFGGNKQHLNVILFADKRWAKDAKSWLPDNNTGAPLLLSTQQASLYQAAQDHFQDFDPLIKNSNDNSASLALSEHRIEQRPLFSMGAFWAAAILVFLGTFAGITIWQKGDKLSALFAPINLEKNDTAGQADNQVVDLTKLSSNNLEQSRIAESNATVIDWQDRKDSSVVETGLSQPKLDEVEPEITQAPLPTNTKNNISTAQQQQTTIEEQASTEETSALSDTYVPNKFAIQFAGFKSIEALETFRVTNNLLGSSEIYTTRRYGGIWYVVIHNKLYDTIEQARQAIASLPELSNRNSPFVKSTNNINQELRLTQTQDTL